MAAEPAAAEAEVEAEAEASVAAEVDPAAAAAIETELAPAPAAASAAIETARPADPVPAALEAAPIRTEAAPAPAPASAAVAPRAEGGSGDRGSATDSLVVGPALGVGSALRVSTRAGVLLGYVVATTVGSDSTRLRLLLEDAETARRVEAALDLANAAGAALVQWVIGLGGTEAPAPITISGRMP